MAQGRTCPPQSSRRRPGFFFFSFLLTQGTHRALAAAWEQNKNPAVMQYGYRNPLDQISMFVLLDLLGAAAPSIPSYFQTTHWAYKKMATIEQRLRKLGILESRPRSPFLTDAAKESNKFSPSYMGDDHQPFMARGVPILHLIPSPFPSVWHTLQDDGEHLDMPSVRDWARIITAFTFEWLDMMEVFPPPERR